MDLRRTVAAGNIRRAVAAGAAAVLVLTLAPAAPATAGRPKAPPGPTAGGHGGAVATVDREATRVGIEVLRRGGNAVDAAVAVAATLGVTEPFSAGIGGGGFFLYYDARTRRVHTIDGRESAPASMRENSFINPATGAPYGFAEARVSGLSVGVPGTVATWEAALRRWGTTSLRTALAPAVAVARRGFEVDEVFRRQVSDNLAIFAQFRSTSELYLPGGQPPAIGSVHRNPDLAATYELIGRRGAEAFYRGPVARDLAAAVTAPPVADAPTQPWAFPIRPGGLSTADLAAYDVRFPAPTRVNYRGLDVYGMPTPSSGGSTVGEALNILATVPLGRLGRVQALHHYIEASSLAYADRNRYVGDDTARPLLDELLSRRYARERACQIDPARALPKPVAPGVPDGSYTGCASAARADVVTDEHGTTHLTIADRWGNVVAYTFTIEQIGGNGVVVPERGFLLNNELTDFNFAPTQGSAPDPNLPAPGKRPRSSMAPTIVLHHGQPYLALGSPGGATIITTVLQTIVNHVDFGLSLPQALAAPRISPRNAALQAEAAFLAGPEAAELTALGHTFTSVAELGAATGVQFLGGGRLVAAAEPVRRGGGVAAVVHPAR